MTLDAQTGKEKELYYQSADPSRGSDFISALSISPDGLKLVFLRREFLSDKKFYDCLDSLMVIPTAGGEAVELMKLKPAKPNSAVISKPPMAAKAGLEWTFDGAHILFWKYGESPEFMMELWRVSAEGGEPENLGFTLASKNIEGLRIHPDGRRIAFYDERMMDHEWWVMENFLPKKK
jgi:Tol biopolymer transport system component